jgi:hypothetical protein
MGRHRQRSAERGRAAALCDGLDAGQLGAGVLARRMQAIDWALRAGRWPTSKSLARELKVDPRTIRRDIEFMRDESTLRSNTTGPAVALNRLAAADLINSGHSSCENTDRRRYQDNVPRTPPTRSVSEGLYERRTANPTNRKR